MTEQLPRRVLWHVFFRSFFIQAGFSPAALQTLGLLYALEPALKALYPDEAVRAKAVSRHLSPFNTHPYAATAILGGIIFHEARIARGEEPPEAVLHFKKTLMGPLAALGDGFFWFSLRPAAGALSAALVPFISIWAPVVFFVLYNAVHFSARGRLFWLGVREGEGIVARLHAAHVPMWGNRLRGAAAFLTGGLGAWLAVRFGTQAGGAVSPLLALGCVAVGVVALVMLERRRHPLVLLYALAAVAIVAGAFL